MSLVLARPIFDMLYFLKGLSVFLSPLYWIGVLTPILILYSLGMRKFAESRVPMSIITLLVLALIQCVIYMLEAYNILDSLQTVLKLTLWYLLVLYGSVTFRRKVDRQRIVQTFFMTSCIAMALLVGEVLFGPLGEVQTSRGYERLQGFFADTVSYGMYAVMFLISGLNIFGMRRKEMINYKVVIVLVVTATSLIAINHVATMLLSGVIIVIYVSLSRKSSFLGPVAFTLLVIITVIVVGDDSGYQGMIGRELEIVTGDRPVEQGFHGRFYRWDAYLDEWTNMPIVGQMLGVGYIVEEKWFSTWTLGAVHSDYLRILFLHGIIGAFVYGIWIISMWSNALKLSSDERFIVAAAISSLLVYQVTTLPTLYPPFMYFAAAFIGSLYHRRTESSI